MRELEFTRETNGYCRISSYLQTMANRGVRVAEIIKYLKIVQDFGSDSRRGKGRIVVLCNLFHNAEKSVWNRFSR